MGVAQGKATQMPQGGGGTQQTKAAARVLVGTNVTIASPGATLDGVAMVAGDRVVLNGQTDGTQNGIYVWNGAAVPMTRSADADTGAELKNAVIAIDEGTSADTIWIVTNNGTITIGVTSITFAKLGITYIGTANRITVTGTVIDIAATYVGQTSITTLGTIATGTWNGSVIAGQYGGTGVANTGKTITVSGNVVIGSTTNTVTFTTSGNTSIALPTSGTLATTTDLASYLPLIGATYATTTGNGLASTTSTLTSGNLISYSSTSAAGITGHTVLNISASGANNGSAQTTYGVQISNTRTGTTSVNVGLKVTASGGASNYAIIATGNVGINKSTPSVALDIVGDGAAVTTTAASATESYFSSVNFGGGFFNIGAGTVANNYSFFNTSLGRFAMFFASSEKFSITSVGNVGVLTNTFGTNAVGVFGIKIGTAPTTAPADIIQIYAKDSSAGSANSTTALFCEQAVETSAAEAATHKMREWINGVEYWRLLKSV